MKYKVNDIFKNQNLSSEELAYWSGQLKEIDEDFSKRKFKFSKLKGNKKYYNVLFKYLEINGYGFLCSKISRNINSVELARLLIDSNLIDKPSINIDTNLKNEIVYDKEFGFRGEYYIKYDTKTFPFEIKSIYYKESKNLRCKLDKDKNRVEILIDINENTKIDLKETIIIYTSLGLKEVPLSIKCNSVLNSKINIRDFQEFKSLCETNSSEAKELFQNSEFRDWLRKKGYITQLLNYDEAFMLSTFSDSEFKSPFNNFCLLNEIYIANSTLGEEETYDKSKEYVSFDFNDKEEVKLFERIDDNSNNTTSSYETEDSDREKYDKKCGFLSKIRGLFKKK